MDAAAKRPSTLGTLAVLAVSSKSMLTYPEEMITRGAANSKCKFCRKAFAAPRMAPQLVWPRTRMSCVFRAPMENSRLPMMLPSARRLMSLLIQLHFCFTIQLGKTRRS